MAHQIPNLICFLPRLTIAFVQYIEARYRIEDEDVVRATSTGAAPTTSEWSTMLLPTKVRLIFEAWLYEFAYLLYMCSVNHKPYIYVVSKIPGAIRCSYVRWFTIHNRVGCVTHDPVLLLRLKFQLMGAQVSLKATLPLAERLATAPDLCNKTGPR